MQSPENKESQKEIMKHQFQEWNEVLKERGEASYDEYVERQYAFYFPTQENNESLFKTEYILVEKIAVPIEQYQPPTKDFLVPDEFKNTEGESWLLFTINPKDHFRPKLIKWIDPSNGKARYYYDQLLILISSAGRAFELTLAEDSFFQESKKPGFNDPLPKLKREPSDNETVPFNEPMYRYSAIHEELEPFQIIHGQSLERLKFLIQQVKRGAAVEDHKMTNHQNNV